MTKSFYPKNIVVYADDDEDDLELIKDAFLQYSEQVDIITFKNGLETLEYLSDSNEGDLFPCLVILDINMPFMDGKETLVKIRKMKHMESVPVVLFSTSSQSVDKMFARKYNAGYIAKPIHAKQMEIIADEFIDHCTEETRKRLKKNFL